VSVEAALTDFMAAAQARRPIQHLGVAVSGGGDSVALLHLLNAWSGAAQARLSVVTVDHGLRPEAAGEAAFVSALCAGLSLPHTTLKWEGWDGTGNLPDAARQARYGLIARWASDQGVDAVALGHTLDDQAETFLMRLARGSGVDGLAAMRRDWEAGGLRWLRPLVEVPRTALRGYLRAGGLDWKEDPSNEDPRFRRVQVRKALELLEPLGITTRRITDTAERMELARQALRACTHAAAARICHVEAGDVLIGCDGLGGLEADIRQRLFAQAVMWVSGAVYKPRLDALREALERVQEGAVRTLHGCLITPKGNTLRIGREYNAVRALVCAPGALWDKRWRLSGDFQPGMEVRALGEGGLGHCKNWRATGLPRQTLVASPAIWQGDRLISAPLAGFGPGWSAEIDPSRGDFLAFLLSH
jgi:tRNA(Ile)-lysidine synthase